MAVIGTFGTFTTARLGIYASQASLQVTGNNIANINTDGYTRQRADLVSLYSTGTAKYANPLSVDIGYGVLVQSTTQLRDPYLDIRYRNENTKLGYYNATLAGMQKISQTLDEVNKGGESQNGVIEDCLQNFLSMLEELAAHVGSEEQDGLVREAAKSLTTFFNTNADQLQKDWDLQRDELNDTVKEVNKCLTNIRNLNEQIRKQGIYGDNALELRDHRNLEIDKLSGYLGINVEYSMERIDQYTEIEKLTITLKDTKDPKTGQPIKLVDGLYACQLTASELEANPYYNASGNKYGDFFAVGTEGAYETADGKTSTSIMDAKLYKLNPKYDPKDPTKGTEYLDVNGNNVTPTPTGLVSVSDKKYLTANGVPTDKEPSDPPAADEAGQVDPNKFLFQIERLEDKFGRPLDRNLATESVVVPLSDNDLMGELQAMRELLTEEGEFASKTDVGAIGVTLTTTEKRAADPNANIKKGIPYYQKRLDLLAQKFAEIFNDANQMAASTVYEANLAAGATPGDTTQFLNKDKGTNFTFADGKQGPIAFEDVTIEIEVKDADGNPVSDENGNPVKERVPLDSLKGREALENQTPSLTQDQINEKLAYAAKCLEALRSQGQLKDEYSFYDGGVLFSNSGNTNDPSGITAGNISIANSWAARTVRVLNTKQADVPDDPTTEKDESIRHSSRNDNIDHMITLFEKQLDYSASEIEPNASGGTQIFFHGSFQEMYTDLGATLGSETQTMMGVTNNYEIMTLDLDNDRISVSGVDLNEEATSMMQFQKSYQAACRLLTTIDSMLDTLINNTLR